MSCCPEGALGKLGTQGYVAKVDLTKLTKYKVSTKSPHFKRVLLRKLMIWISTMWGQDQSVLFGTMTFLDLMLAEQGEIIIRNIFKSIMMLIKANCRPVC